MKKRELMKALEGYHEDTVVICKDESGCWDNIESVVPDGSNAAIVFGGGSPFSDEQ